MNVVFVGGGSFRTLPILRGVLQNPKVMNGGEIRLVDFNLPRVETVGRLIMETPEFKKSACKLIWTDKLVKALPGADVVSISFPVGSLKVNALSEQACDKRGIFGSDQLSASGAFRSVTGGTIIWDIAKKMEKYCPDAWLFDYANPVAVYSGMVNNHTKIRALGICGGFVNHRWDLPRLILGQDVYSNEFTDVASAGVNHCAILLRGKFKGKDLYKMMDKAINKKGWQPCRIPKFPKSEKFIRHQLKFLAEMRRRFGYVVFSTEGDGFSHICPELYIKPINGKRKPWTVAQINKIAREQAAARDALDREFRAHLDQDLPASFWAQDSLENPHFGATPDAAAAVILRALSGQSREWLAASLPNNGAVKGFKDRAVLEYSFTLDKDGIHPDANLEVPDCFHGLMTSLSTHQTLLGDAIANKDPKIFAQALYAYPIHQDEPETRKLWKDLLKIHADEMPKVFQKAKDYC
jgi:6-phospho-beta-glucosidase